MPTLNHPSYSKKAKKHKSLNPNVHMYTLRAQKVTIVHSPPLHTRALRVEGVGVATRSLCTMCNAWALGILHHVGIKTGEGFFATKNALAVIQNVILLHYLT